MSAAVALDPYNVRYEARAWRFLYRLNPLAKILGTLPAMIVLVFARDLATPLSFLALSYLLILLGANLTRAVAATLFLVIPAFVLVMSFSFGVWTDGARVDETTPLFRLGDWTFYTGAWFIGLATALRLMSLVVLALVTGFTTTGPDLVRSLVQQLRLPYRIGYTALAAYRFVPRFGHELEVIRSAHRVRGTSRGRGPIAAVRRHLGYVVPLLAGAIRHAERVALAMDSRAFGAHSTRTERYRVPFRVRDGVFVVLVWAATAVLLLVVPGLGLLPDPTRIGG